MITTIILIAWIGIPLALIIINESKIGDLEATILHCRILFWFCEVRDAAAIKALKGEMDEEGRLFKLLYTTNAGIIHNNRNLGKCFIHLIRDIYRMEKTEIVHGGNKLVKEIEAADEETKQIVNKYVHAVMRATFSALPFILFDRLVRKIKTTDERVLNFASKVVIFPREKRAVSRFGSILARAACI